MTPDQRQQFNMLQAVITEFSSSPNEKRSRLSNGSCKYNPPANNPLSSGCAIGVFLSVKTAVKLDKIFNSAIRDIMKSPSKQFLPKWMQKMNPDFLNSIQSLHDGDSHWDKDNISNYGKVKVESICVEYKLPFCNLKFLK